MTLSADGFMHLGQCLTPEQVGEIHAHFSACDCLPGYLPNRANPSDKSSSTINRAREASALACYSLEDVIKAPYLLDFATSDKVISLAKEWIGTDPVIYSINAYWSFPSRKRKPRSGTQCFHRDNDEDRFACLFFYLTDFLPDDGEQRYVYGSHDDELFRKIHQGSGSLPYDSYWNIRKDSVFHDSIERDFPVAILEGKAGTCVMMLPRGIHCAGIPKSERLLAWVRYGTHANRAYRADKTQPVTIQGMEKSPLLRLMLQ